MAEKTTFVKIDRNIMRWGWYTDSKTVHIFLHLILKANIEDHNFRGVFVRRGQLFTSLPHLAIETGLTEREVRTALNHLKATGEVTDERQPFGRLITVVSYDEYQTNRQTNRQANDSQPTGKRQSTVTQSKNNKEHIKNEKKESAPAPPDGGGRAEWEIRQKVPDMFIGQFESEEAYLSLMSGEGYDPH